MVSHHGLFFAYFLKDVKILHFLSTMYCKVLKTLYLCNRNVTYPAGTNRFNPFSRDGSSNKSFNNSKN
jgi:hypothetical protein